MLESTEAQTQPTQKKENFSPKDNQTIKGLIAKIRNSILLGITVTGIGVSGIALKLKIDSGDSSLRNKSAIEALQSIATLKSIEDLADTLHNNRVSIDERDLTSPIMYTIKDTNNPYHCNTLQSIAEQYVKNFEFTKKGYRASHKLSPIQVAYAHVAARHWARITNIKSVYEPIPTLTYLEIDLPKVLFPPKTDDSGDK